MATRISRREFQQALTERLRSAARGETTRTLLGALSGQERWLFDLAETGEILPLTPLADVPLTRPWFAGIANVRGTLYSVVDFSAFRGAVPTPRGSDSRLLLIGMPAGGNSALLVNRTLGLRSLSSLTEEPQLPDNAPTWMGKRYLDNKGNTWHSIRVRQLLAHPDFLDVGQ